MSCAASQQDAQNGSEKDPWRRWITKPVFHVGNILCWCCEAQTSFQLHDANVAPKKQSAAPRDEDYLIDSSDTQVGLIRSQMMMQYFAYK